MAINWCDICGCIPPNIEPKQFYQAAINLLCNIETNTSPAGAGLNLLEVGGVAITLGQKAMAASLPVTFASDQPGFYAEDSASASGQVGIAPLVIVRDSTFSTTITTTDDYGMPRGNSFGASYVSIRAALEPGASQLSDSILKLEDGPTATGDAGVATFAKRLDVLTSQTNTDGDYTLPTADSFGRQYVDTVLRSAGAATQTSVANATSVTLVAANAQRKYLRIQNNTAANIMISLAAFTLTGIVPSGTNIGFVLAAGATYESTPAWCSASAITVYQTSGGAVTTISAIEA